MTDELRVLADDLRTLADELDRLRAAVGEARTVLRFLDDLANVWGDEATFKSCRDRLRAALEGVSDGQA